MTTPDAPESDPAGPAPLDEGAGENSANLHVEKKPKAALMRCPSCRKKFASDKKFCPFCGRSRKELEECAEQNKIVATSAKETLGAWQKLHSMATFYVVLLALNFISVYVLTIGKPWGLLILDMGIVIVSGCWAANSKKFLKGRFKPGFPLLLLAIMPLSALVTYAVTTFDNQIFITLLGLRDTYEHVRGTETFQDMLIPLPVQVISTCIIPGIFEEIFFRGLVQGTLEEMMTRREALWVQAVIFAIAHLNPIGFFTYLVFMGLYLGWLRNKSGSLIPGMLVHFTHNLLVVLNEHYHIVNY